MPRHQSTAAATRIVKDATTQPTVDLVAELAEPLAEYMLLNYEREDWQGSPLVEPLARVAALLESQRREIPAPVLIVLRKASEAGQSIGVA